MGTLTLPVMETCIGPECNRERSPRSRLYCNTHYCQKYRTGELWPIGSPRSLRRVAGARSYGLCAHDGCPKQGVSKGYCHAHYGQWKRRGKTFDQDGSKHYDWTLVECSAMNCHLLQRSPRQPYCDLHARRNRTLKHFYGITLAERDDMEVVQGGRCPICRELTTLHVDHNHLTGRVRGLLCGSCNRAIGLFADNADSLRRAAQYLGGDA